jgi:hypothetical protein
MSEWSGANTMYCPECDDYVYVVGTNTSCGHD